jgi:large subunit ribosomal protein L27e
MKKFLKPGRVVIILGGRYAGKKAVILKLFYEGSSNRKFGHALVAGISRSPRKVTKGMSETRVSRRIRIKPFVKYVNFNHFMPTRYVLANELDVKGVIKSFESHSTLKKEGEEAKRDPLQNADFRSSLRKDIKKTLESKYQSLDLNSASEENQIVKFFFKPLRF